MRAVLKSVALSGLIVGMGALPGAAQSAASASTQTDVDIIVMPFATLQFVTPPLMSLSVPPPDFTTSGVRFDVTGNATATLQAEPTSFISVPSEGFLGEAVLGGNSIGYRVLLRFPRTGLPGSPIASAVLPGYAAGPTEPPLSVNLTASGGVRQGEIHLEANEMWTEDGSMAVAGVYQGQVILTLSAQ